MSTENLINWWRNPESMNRESLLELQSLLEEYPCFTIARILYLKNLLVLKDLRFSKMLIQTAISVPDRKRLYYFIEDKPMPDSEYSHENELASAAGFSIIDRFLHLADKKAFHSGKQMEAEADRIPVPELPQEEQPNPDSAADPSDLLKNSNFTLDYASYLDQTSAKQDEVVPPMQGQDLIDAFLENTPEEVKIGPIEEQDIPATGSEALLALEDYPEDTFTETLAKIYLRQKRYEKALEIFKSLSLNYPEKNVYFADQIRYLEKLIINIKNE